MQIKEITLFNKIFTNKFFDYSFVSFEVKERIYSCNMHSDAGRWKTLGVKMLLFQEFRYIVQNHCIILSNASDLEYIVVKKWSDWKLSIKKFVRLIPQTALLWFFFFTFWMQNFLESWPLVFKSSQCAVVCSVRGHSKTTWWGAQWSG